MNNHGDIVANTLQYYRERTKEDDLTAPKPYLEIQKHIQKIIKSGKRTLIDIKDSYSIQTVVIRFEYANDRWALGRSICYLEGEEVEIPYTIHYSDIYCKRLHIKMIVEGENPYDQRP
jgi:hypothetical protein